MSEYELYHYGVLGMKWGVRKNPTKAYVKASKKKRKLEFREKRIKDNVKQLGDWDKDLEKREKNFAEDVRVKKASRDLAARKMDVANKKFQSNPNDFFGNNARNLKKATSEYNSRNEDYEKSAERYNESVLDRAANTKALDYWTKKAERAMSKSQSWDSAMNAAFKDVSPEAIAAGKAMLEKRKRK